MVKLHTCQVNDVGGDTHLLRGRTLREIHAEVGPAWPIVLDGRPGKLSYGEGEDVAFVPAD